MRHNGTKTPQLPMFSICSMVDVWPSLTEQELESLHIEQGVFHIVGPGEEHFQLLAPFDASRHAPFF
jgi:hypothetical protein